jgi:hypothetical protein
MEGEMKKTIRSLISEALKTFEQGMFQDFCLDFLPLYDFYYDGLQRHGATADGKTRKGTPDLIKTLPSAEQIAVQCSVDANYWKVPQKEKNILNGSPAAT